MKRFQCHISSIKLRIRHTIILLSTVLVIRLMKLITTGNEIWGLIPSELYLSGQLSATLQIFTGQLRVDGPVNTFKRSENVSRMYLQIHFRIHIATQILESWIH